MSASFTMALQPHDWAEYRGQEGLKTRLNVHIASALKQDVPLPNVLLNAPAGYGKTTMGCLIANRLGKRARVIEMPFTPEDVRDLSSAFGSVLILDEIHRLPQAKQEELLPLLDAGRYKPKGKPMLNLFGVPIIGCTTEAEKLIDPLRDRFQIQPQYEPYSDDELGTIVSDMAARFSLAMTQEDYVKLACASGGVPRKAGSLVLAAHDIRIATGATPTARDVLEFCNLEYDGLGVEHRRYMKTMWNMAEAVGLPSMRNLLDMNEHQVRDVERLVLRHEYVTLTPRGRELTEKGGARCRELLGI